MKHAIKSSSAIVALLLVGASSSEARITEQQAMVAAPVASLDATLDASLLAAVPFGSAHRTSPDGATTSDGLLSTALAAALIALQLRRRQKSLRTPRLRT